jgi:hypothetical protein
MPSDRYSDQLVLGRVDPSNANAPLIILIVAALALGWLAFQVITAMPVWEGPKREGHLLGVAANRLRDKLDW